MKQLIIKYTFFLIAATLISRFILALFIALGPDIMSWVNYDGSRGGFSIGYFESVVMYLFNIVIAIFMKKDLDKQNLSFIPLLIVTILYSNAGVILFLLISYHNSVTLKEETI